MAGSVRIRTEIPGPASRELARRMRAATPSSLGHALPIFVARGEGALLEDVDGNVFLDFAGGIGTMNVGHSDAEVVEAIREQAGLYTHTCFSVAAYEPYVALAEVLQEITPGSFPKKVVLFNSGAEAVENAVKIARAYTGRPGVLVFERAFHGRTLLALGMTGQIQPYKVGFGPFPPAVHRIPFPYPYRCSLGRADCRCALECLEQGLEALFRSDCPPEQAACLVAEPVLGEGGFVIPPEEFFPRLRQVCDRHGILLVADEVQTGFGRTGRMFALEHSGTEPDLMVLAKSLAGGLPLSAVVGRAEILDSLVTGSLGGTYGGNPVACRAALASIARIQDLDLPGRARVLGSRLLGRMRGLQEQVPILGEVRALGAMAALEIVARRGSRTPDAAAAGRVVQGCLQRGLLLLKAGAGGNVLRTLMPLVMTDEQMEEACDILEAALLGAGAGGQG